MTTNVKATPRRAFGAEKVMQLDMPDGKVAHAEILSEEEIQRRMEAEFSQPSAA